MLLNLFVSGYCRVSRDTHRMFFAMSTHDVIHLILRTVPFLSNRHLLAVDAESSLFLSYVGLARLNCLIVTAFQNQTIGGRNPEINACSCRLKMLLPGSSTTPVWLTSHLRLQLADGGEASGAWSLILLLVPHCEHVQDHLAQVLDLFSCC